jgi:hypothetical protein
LNECPISLNLHLCHVAGMKRHFLGVSASMWQITHFDYTFWKVLNRLPKNLFSTFLRFSYDEQCASAHLLQGSKLKWNVYDTCLKSHARVCLMLWFRSVVACITIHSSTRLNGTPHSQDKSIMKLRCLRLYECTCDMSDHAGVDTI